MVEPGTQRAAGEVERLENAKADFVASFGRRLDILRNALNLLEKEPNSRSRRDTLKRRVHAMGSASEVLGFEAIAQALDGVDKVLAASPPGGVQANQIATVSRTFDALPSLIWGAPSRSSERPPSMRPQSSDEAGAPVAVMVFGAPPLAGSLRSAMEFAGNRPLECFRTEEVGRALDLGRATAPDVALIDYDKPGASEVLEALLGDEDPVPVIVVGTFDNPDSASGLVGTGVSRVLPKPVTPDTLRRTVLEARARGRERPIEQAPLGAVTVDELGARIAAELQRGLIDSVEPTARHARVDLGDGTDVLAAVWSTVARVRELVTLHSEGRVRFAPGGPEGSIPLAPWNGPERRRGDRQEADSATGVNLKGRRVLVVDDDPAICWFVSGLLRVAGAEVVEAHDGVQALSVIYEQWPELVVSDVLMPKLDGFGLCRMLKRDVALRDTPVILLSWKEDLLRRVRELGADADGYLRKEAAASTVVERVREVLRSRARVESRIAAGGEVRGRLDGLTPRLILELVAKADVDATVHFRDAAFLFEVEMRGGRVLSASRTAESGASARGEGVLRGLLGVGAGRFAIVPNRDPVKGELSGTPREVLEAPIGELRAAERALATDRIMNVCELELDGAALRPYLAAVTPDVRSLTERLIDGASPRSLAVQDDNDIELLDRVLTDAARRGAVRAVRDEDGVDLLARAREALGAERFSPAPPAAAPEPMLDFGSRPESDAGSTAPSVESDPPRGDGSGSSQGAPETSHAAEPAKPPADSHSDRGATRAKVKVDDSPHGDASDAAKAPALDDLKSTQVSAPVVKKISMPARPKVAVKRSIDEKPKPEAKPEADTAGEETAAEPEAPEPAQAEPAAAKPDLTNALKTRRLSEDLRDMETPAPAGVDDDQGPETKASSAPPMAADEAAKPQVIGAKTLESASAPAVAAKKAVAEAKAKTGSPPEPKIATKKVTFPAKKPVTKPPRVEKLKPIAKKSIQFPTKVEPETVAPPVSHRAIVDVGTASAASQTAGESASESESQVQATEPVPSPSDSLTEAASQAPNASENAATATAEPAQEPPVAEAKSSGKSDSQTKPSEESGTSGQSDAKIPPQVEVPGTDAKPASEDEAVASGSAAGDASALPAGDESPADKVSRDSSPLAAARAVDTAVKGKKRGGMLQAGLVFVAASAVAYGGVRFAMSGDETATQVAATPSTAEATLDETLPVKAPEAPPAAKSAEAKKEEAAPVVTPEDLPIPSDSPVQSGNGMLEVDTGDGDSIYVDDVFVGRGPKKLVEMPPGKHSVRTKLKGKERVFEAEVKAGRMTRLPLPPKWTQ